ncbi:MAG TPA: response regulator [Candidatus Paceibacterota bacterium]
MKKILLIEDDPLLIDVYSMKLKQSGFEVYVVENGEKALAAAVEQRPDLILLDIVLPHIDGWDILASFRSSETLKDTRIVILSNLGQKEEVEKGLRLGAAKYLIKAHYTPSEIVQEITSIIGNPS